MAENDAILGELAEIADKAAMVQRGKEKHSEILPNLGEKKAGRGNRHRNGNIRKKFHNGKQKEILMGLDCIRIFYGHETADFQTVTA